jgi:hypothetical protein
VGLTWGRGGVEPTIKATTSEDLVADHGTHTALTGPATTPQGGDKSQIRRIKNLPIIADGALNPDEISDELAYRHVLTAMIGTDGANVEARRSLILSRVGLSAESREAVTEILSGAREELAAIDTALQSRAQDGPTLRDRRRDYLDGLRWSIGARLGTSEMTRLDTYVRERVKRQIVVYRWPDEMSAGR